MSCSACVYVHMSCFLHHPDSASPPACPPASPPQWLLRSALKQPAMWMRKYIPPRIHSPITPAPGETFNPPQDGEANPTSRFSPGAPQAERQPVEARRREMNGTIKRLKQKDKKKERAGKKRRVEGARGKKGKREEDTGCVRSNQTDLVSARTNHPRHTR